jgi:hypothetical protein
MAQIVETVDRSDHACELHRYFRITKIAVDRAVGGRRDSRRESGFRLLYCRRQRQSPGGRMIHVNPLAGEPLVERRDLDRAPAEAGVELDRRQPMLIKRRSRIFLRSQQIVEPRAVTQRERQIDRERRIPRRSYYEARDVGRMVAG